MTASADQPARSRRVRAGSGSPTAEPRRVTIQDVARQAEVSVSAVSKVLRDAYGVSPEMRVKVTAAIDRLGYRPHAGARTMRGSSYTIGVMLTELSSPFQPEIVEGITRELEPSPFQEILVTGGISPERQQRSIEALIDRQVDGLILIAPATSTSWLEDLGASVGRYPGVAVVLTRHECDPSFRVRNGDEPNGAIAIQLAVLTTRLEERCVYNDLHGRVGELARTSQAGLENGLQDRVRCVIRPWSALQRGTA